MPTESLETTLTMARDRRIALTRTANEHAALAHDDREKGRKHGVCPAEEKGAGGAAGWRVNRQRVAGAQHDDWWNTHVQGSLPHAFAASRVQMRRAFEPRLNR